MESIVTKVQNRKTLPIRMVQFGEGNFLRAFVDYMIDRANEAGLTDCGVAIVKPIEFGSLERFEKQNNLYTVNLRGKLDGEVVNSSHIVTCIEKTVDIYADLDSYMELARLDTLRFVVSNTTEAGIVLDRNDKIDGIPATYPGKLTKFLFERFKFFAGDKSKGLILLPVELIENNGGKLKECVLALSEAWNLGADFAAWIEEACIFCSTLVDRIVTGYPREEAAQICEKLGYSDELLDVGEPFGLWVIESDRDISAELPLDRAGMPVVFTDDQRPYRERKVRILNGAHTSTVLLGWLSGLPIVRECMEDKVIRAFMEKAVGEEIAPQVKLPAEEVAAFAAAVYERFENPFIRHSVLDISLNSVSKWKSRILPSFKDYFEKNGKIAPALTMSMAGLLAFYGAGELSDGKIDAKRPGDGEAYTVRDDAEALAFIAANSKKSSFEYAKAVLSNEKFWGEDLCSYPAFCETVASYLDAFRADGVKATVAKLVEA